MTISSEVELRVLLSASRLVSLSTYLSLVVSLGFLAKITKLFYHHVTSVMN
jgi:uncharacterized membrane protein YqhA